MLIVFDNHFDPAVVILSSDPVDRNDRPSQTDRNHPSDNNAPIPPPRRLSNGDPTSPTAVGAWSATFPIVYPAFPKKNIRRRIGECAPVPCKPNEWKTTYRNTDKIHLEAICVQRRCRPQSIFILVEEKKRRSGTAAVAVVDGWVL